MQYDLVAGTATILSAIVPAGAYQGGTLGANGYIYMLPTAVGSAPILELNTSAGTVTTFGSTPAATAYKGSALALDGNIYAPPATATKQWIQISPSNHTVNAVGTTTALATSFIGAALGANGKVYGIGGTILTGSGYSELDPSTVVGGTVTPSVTGWFGSGTNVTNVPTILAQDGNIYSFGSSTGVYFSPNGGGTTPTPITTTIANPVNATLANNGLLYLFNNA